MTPPPACWHLISSKWFGMILFSFYYQRQTPVAWRSNFGKGKNCMAYYNNKLASQPSADPTVEIPRGRWQMTTQMLPGINAFPHPPPAPPWPTLSLHAPQPTPAQPRAALIWTVFLLIHCTHHFSPGQASSGNGSWNLSNAIVQFFSKCRYGNQISTCHFHLSVWKCFPCEDSLYTWVCCLLHIFFFLFSHFLSSFVSVLSFNMSTDCWACLTRQT